MDEIRGDDDNITMANEDVQEFIVKMGYQYSPMMTAAVMMVHSMKLYRQHLSDEDYEMMMTNIFQSRNRIKNDS
ncbi:hypothetical protein EB118_20190 [bacterium]|nr:hypothetical protein [bacterium]